jgi:hypothetical protein
MAGEAHDSAAIMAAASRSLADQRAGGRRLAAIGRHSAALRRADLVARLRRAAIGVSGLVIGVMVAGMVIGGIGIGGVMLAGAGVAVAGALLLNYPRLAVPDQQALPKAPLGRMVGQVELWLEAQRPQLPAPAVRLVDRIGTQLDALNLQLASLQEESPAAADVRRLVGEHLPGLVSAYTSVPRHLRGQAHAGTTPDQQLTSSLATIAQEIDAATRSLAEGALDRLAIQSRYLENKYAGADEASPALLPPAQ